VFVIRLVRPGPDVTISGRGIAVYRLVGTAFVAWADVIAIPPPRVLIASGPLAATVIPVSTTGPDLFYVPIPAGVDPRTFRAELEHRWSAAAK
jgi:hypothetical protein